MRNKVLFAALATSSLAFAAIGAASAADLGRRVAPPPMAAPVAYTAPLYNWTGFYLGANLGYGWGSGDGTIDIGGVGSGPVSGSGNGVLGGVQAGYNWQSGNFVFGVETDIQASGGKGDVTGSPGAATLTATAKNPWFSTLRGRIGIADDRWLYYVTGGGAYGQSKLEGTVSAPGSGDFSSSKTAWSWTLGGGVETALWDRWTGKLEYLYFGTPDKVPVPPGTVSISGNSHSQLIRAGLNYRF